MLKLQEFISFIVSANVKLTEVNGQTIIDPVSIEEAAESIQKLFDRKLVEKLKSLRTNSPELIKLIQELETSDKPTATDNTMKTGKVFFASIEPEDLESCGRVVIDELHIKPVKKIDGDYWIESIGYITGRLAENNTIEEAIKDLKKVVVNHKGQNIVLDPSQWFIALDRNLVDNNVTSTYTINVEDGEMTVAQFSPAFMMEIIKMNLV